MNHRLPISALMGQNRAAEEDAMSTIKRMMAKRCDVCPLCKWARNNPDKLLARAIALHGKICPFWRAWEEVYGQGAERRS